MEQQATRIDIKKALGFIIVLGIVIAGVYYIGGFMSCKLGDGTTIITTFGPKCIKPEIRGACNVGSTTYILPTNYTQDMLK